MEQLAAQQEQIGNELQRIIRNFRKDSPVRKTADYVTAHLKQLDTLWVQFEGNNEQLLDYKDDHTTHPYFKKQYYERFEGICDEYRTQLLALGKALQSEGESSKKHSEDKESDDARFEIQLPDDSELPNPEEDTADKLIKLQKGRMKTLSQHLRSIEANSSFTRVYCERKLKLIDEYWKKITEVNEQLLSIIEDIENSDYQQSYYDEMAVWVDETIILLTTKLSEQDTPNVPAPRVLTDVPSSRSPMDVPSARLPKIKLPTFDGNYLHWKPFRDLYLQLVHNQPLSLSEKMYYLSTSIYGEAKTLIRHIPPTGENYSSAWEILESRFNNERLLATTLLNRFLEQSPIHQDSAAALKRLHDISKECLMGLTSLGIAIDQWDPIIVHLIVKKMDKTTHNLYEQSLKDPRKLQSVQGLLQFLELRFQALESVNTQEKKGKNFNKERSTFLTSSTIKCIVCTNNHPLYFCKKFLDMTPKARLNLLVNNKRCINCMRDGHPATRCSLRGCSRCNKKHNTLVHVAESAVNKEIKPTPTQPKQEQPISLSASNESSEPTYVLLGTAIVDIMDRHGRWVACRVLLDSGSQINLITEQLYKRLGLSSCSDTLQINGIGGTKQRSQRRVNITIASRCTGFNLQLDAFILPRIISHQPSQLIDTSQWNLPKNINLADPTFNKPGDIDLLIGAESYFELLSVGQIALGRGLPRLQKTVLGWTVGGKTSSNQISEMCCAISSTESEQIQGQLEKFWRLEEGSEPVSELTDAERRCEELFLQTLSRTKEGRFLVKLPFSQAPSGLGQSKDMAFRRLLSLERKLARNNELKSQYKEFMKEYKELGHMKEVSAKDIPDCHYFLPHHCVLKPDSTTTKLRVVFDASAKTTRTCSLNDLLYTGPTIQDDIFSHLLRFRLPRWVFTADIEKMFRQITVSKEDTVYQLIMWRNEPTEPIRYYALQTVTYGTTSAPYMATKCLSVLAEQYQDKYPLASSITQNNFYMDDVMAGDDDLKTALEMQNQLQLLLRESKFNLRKWCANHPQLLSAIAPEDREMSSSFTDDNKVKTLGLIWIPRQDMFAIKITPPCTSKVTKRTALSDIAHIFDPLGLTSPVIIRAKIFIQELWRMKLDWDASLPQELHSQWTKYREELKELEKLTVPRHIFYTPDYRDVEIHVFSDASERAYGTAIYIRSEDNQGLITTRLLCAKSRVAPTKSITLPRLELCAAKLGAELTHRVKKDLNLGPKATYYWTDSEIVLAWIQSEASQYQTFVANRIATIQSLSSTSQWRHVSSKENPADIVSRGISPAKLGQCKLWFDGPQFLQWSKDRWPHQKINTAPQKLEKKQSKTVLVADRPSAFLSSIDHKNSYKYLLRVFAWVIRFTRNTRKPTEEQIRDPSVTVKELSKAETYILREVQGTHFSEDLRRLRQGKPVERGSELTTLAPFIDDRGIIRVGGRLEKSSLPYDTKHPVLLPHQHPVTKMILTQIHQENLHVGSQTLLAITRQRFWPLRGRRLATSIVHHCIRCTRTNPREFGQLMGDLPQTRTQAIRPFTNTGVDFCGPVFTHFKIRGKPPQKAYISVFCCFATKAVHLELVTDLTTEGFIGALKRFMGRRGISYNIYCDNATNFVGANNQLRELQDTLNNPSSREKITNVATAKGIEFHFIPPRAPHFGGLWEAAVKSTKGLLHKSLGSASLTYEEMETTLIEIEAVLNSRPLTPMSSDPNDLSALTPGHFLIGEPLASIVDPPPPTNTNILRRWKLVSYVRHEFWRRWSREYLCELQQRYKWKQRCQNAEPGMMVLLKEDNLPPLKWALGRIITTIPGSDNQVRVADVRTANGVFRRPIHKLCPLPVDKEDESATAEAKPQATAPSRLTERPRKRNTKVRIHPINPNWLKTTKEDAQSPNIETTTTTPKGQRVDPGPASRNTKVTKTSIPAWTLLVLTCLTLPIRAHNPVRTTPLQDNKFIYFENLGSVDLISNEWHLIVYFQLQHYWDEIILIQKGISQLEGLCHSLETHQSCRLVSIQFSLQARDIVLKNELITQGNNRLTNRKRRAPLDIVGNIAHSLFGLLDHKYAAEMSSTISQVQSNEKHLLELIKNQTSIIDTTTNIMRNNQETINRQLQQLEQSIVQLDGKIFKQEQQNDKQQLFFTISTHLTLLLINHLRTQDALFDVIATTHHGKISTFLLRPEQLLQELQRIRTYLPTGLTLPFNGDHILRMYEVMSIEGRLTPEHAIFRIKIPLALNEPFEVLRIIPIPQIINDTMVTMQTSSEFIIVNLHRDQFSLVQHPIGNTCIKPEGKSHLCRQNGPIYRSQTSENLCELRVLRQLPITTHCEFKTTAQRNFWMQLYHRNKWIYVLPHVETLRTVCGNIAEETRLQGRGILELDGNCTIRLPDVIIHSFNIYQEQREESYIPSANITITMNNVTLHQSPYQPLMKTQEAQKELTDLQTNINQLRTEEYLPEELHHHDIHQFAVGYTCLFLLIVLTAVFSWLYRSRRENLAPKPKPRSTRPGQFTINLEESS